MLLGQEVELVLRAAQVALAVQLAGADGDLRLQDVVAGAERIGLRDRRSWSGAAAGTASDDASRRAAAARRSARRSPAARIGRPAMSSSVKAPMASAIARAEVGLLEDQRRRHGDQHARNDQAAQRQAAFAGRRGAADGRARSTSATFMNSDGCSPNGPTLSQRRAPPPLTPMSGTSSSAEHDGGVDHVGVAVERAVVDADRQHHHHQRRARRSSPGACTYGLSRRSLWCVALRIVTRPTPVTSRASDSSGHSMCASRRRSILSIARAARVPRAGGSTSPGPAW